MSQHLYNTVLQDRVLWYDGDSSYQSKELLRIIKKGYSVNWVDALTPEILKYNNLADINQQIGIKTQCNPLNLDWDLPEYYKKLDVVSYIINQHDVLTHELSDDERTERDIRLATELVKYREMDLIDVLRTIIYIINTLVSVGTVWGVGRGSSVSSYVLYIIGVHDVDSHTYQLDIDDFLHE